MLLTPHAFQSHQIGLLPQATHYRNKEERKKKHHKAFSLPFTFKNYFKKKLKKLAQTTQRKERRKEAPKETYRRRVGEGRPEAAAGARRRGETGQRSGSLIIEVRTFLPLFQPFCFLKLPLKLKKKKMKESAQTASFWAISKKKNEITARLGRFFGAEAPSRFIKAISSFSLRLPTAQSDFCNTDRHRPWWDYGLEFYFSCSYIKDYDGGILMECHIDPKLPYTDLSTMIRRQRQVRQSGAPSIDNILGCKVRS